MKCTECGAEVAIGAVRCPTCGADLASGQMLAGQVHASAAVDREQYIAQLRSAQESPGRAKHGQSYGWLVALSIVIVSGIVIATVVQNPDTPASSGSVPDSGASPSSEQTVPRAAIDEVYALDDEADKYIEVLEAEDTRWDFSVRLTIKYVPAVVPDLEDAYSAAEAFSHAIAEETVAVLAKYGVEKDVSVWAELPLGEGKVAILGKTRYFAEDDFYRFDRYTR